VKDTRNIIFVDIDGTIIDATRGLNEPTEKTKYAFRELRKNNLVFIASGRSKSMMPKWMDELNPNGYVLCNGSVVMYEDKIIYEEAIDKEKVKHLVEYCKERHAACFLEDLDAIYVEDLNDPIFKKFLSTWRLDTSIFKEAKDKSFNTYIIMTAHGNEEECSDLKEKFENDFDIRRHKGFTSFDLNAFGINKGNGIKKTIHELNLDINNSYAFGDGINDVEMLKTVKHGILMKNCQKGLENLDFERCDDVLNDGLYYELIKRGLIKPME